MKLSFKDDFNRLSLQIDYVLFEDPKPYPQSGETFTVLGLQIEKLPPPTDYGPCERYWAKCPITGNSIFPYPGKYLVKMPNGSYRVMRKSEFDEVFGQ